MSSDTPMRDVILTPAVPHRRRLDYVDGVRALAAIFVVLHHMWITIWPRYPYNDGPMVLGWLVYGHLSVSVFIVVSGFSLAIAPARNEWRLKGGALTFLRRRAWRIIPTYWAALALSCIVFGLITPGVTGDNVSLKAIAVHGVLLQDVVNSPKPNGAFWSIAVEWQIYFLFPLLLWLRRRVGLQLFILISGVTVIAAYLGAVTVPMLHRILNVTPQYALLFVFGAAAATVLQHALDRRSARWLSIGFLVGAVSLIALCVVQGSVWIDAEYFWIDLLAGATTACGLARLACPNPPRVAAFLSTRPARELGLISYSIYCVHLPVLWLVWHSWLSSVDSSPTTRFLILLVVGLPVVVGASWLFSQVFEKPFLTHRSFASLRDLLREGFRRGRPTGGDPVLTESQSAATGGSARPSS